MMCECMKTCINKYITINVPPTSQETKFYFFFSVLQHISISIYKMWILINEIDDHVVLMSHGESEVVDGKIK